MEVIKDVLNGFMEGKKFFTVPVYQRKYDWRKETCRKLFEDIIRIVQTGKSHFLGTFVYQKKSVSGSSNFTDYIIIDGQQRITSIVLLAKVLCDVSDEEDKSDIQSTFIRHNVGKGMAGKFKLRPTEYDSEIFEKLMRYENFDDAHFEKSEKNLTMYLNYDFFRTEVSEALKRYNINPSEIYQAISKLNIVGINIEPGENPQEIFESLNSTGQSLTQSDLIRNYLLMSLDYDYQEELYKKYWLEIERLLKSAEETEEFMVQYLILKRKSDAMMWNEKRIRLSGKNLYESFKGYFKENYSNGDELSPVEAFLKDLFRYAKFYSHFLFSEDSDYHKMSLLDKKFYELTFLLEVKNAPIILMNLYDKYEKNKFDESTFVEFVEALVSLSFRAKVCKSNGITAQFAGNVVARLDKVDNLDSNLFWKIINFGKGRYAFPNDENFKDLLIESDLFSVLRSKGCRYLLYSLELHSEHSKELPRYSETTVEHIMPKKLNGWWTEYLKAKRDENSHEIFLHTLGNLALMNKDYNSRLSNSDFYAKKKEYGESNFFYTRKLQDYNDWTSVQIQMRATKLANAALKIWTLPEKYNKVNQSFGNIYNLDSDFGTLTGKKPEKLTIAEKEYEINSWRKLLQIIIDTLYALDPNIFKESVQKDNVPRKGKFFSVKSGANDHTVEGNFDTEVLLKIAKAVVENFDSAGETNFKDEIWFVLKRPVEEYRVPSRRVDKDEHLPQNLLFQM